jgi:bifunctional UDP-N-acetylglucosamine pyrophosphorylase / glucosamine-1-phosphate N-acetyltransferase
MPAPTVVILAAGHGTRMRSRVPKLLHDLCGRPLIDWPIRAARRAGAARIVVVIAPDSQLASALPADVEVAVQRQARGTADAVLAAAAQIESAEDVVILAGDVPLLGASQIVDLVALRAAEAAAAAVLTTRLADPAGYGRVLRGPDGSVERVVETKIPGDASADELAIDEVNTGVYGFDGGALLDALAKVRPDNAQGELYLTDVLALLAGSGSRVSALLAVDGRHLLGVNDRAQLAAVRAEAQRRIQEAHMLAGVTICQPSSTSIDVDVQIGADTLIEPCTQLLGETTVGKGATIGPHTTVIDARLGDGVRVLHSHLIDCQLLEGASVGPFAYLRPGALLREDAKVGTFVEVKNSDVGPGAKVPHLSYVGDTDIGEHTNLGAGSITANYDGRAKHRTTIGARVHGGVDTSYVAPVTVGDDAWTAAGSVITGDIPAGSLGVARARQRNVDRYDERRRSDGEDH